MAVNEKQWKAWQNKLDKESKEYSYRMQRKEHIRKKNCSLNNEEPKSAFQSEKSSETEAINMPRT